MGYLQPQDAEELQRMFGALKQPVDLHLYSDEPELAALMGEVARTGGALVRVHPIAEADAPRARALGIDRAPAMALTSPSARGRLLFYGHPLGYEMSALVMAILDLGGTTPDSALVGGDTRRGLEALAEDTFIQVFTTPG